MKTSLNITLAAFPMGTTRHGGRRHFRAQFVPSLIFMFIAWPVLLTQIAGMVEQAKLDEQALAVVEQSLVRHASAPAKGATSTQDRVCAACAATIAPAAKFCQDSGAKAA